jgi:hypothetical protein
MEVGLVKLIHNYRTLGRTEFLRRWKEGSQSISPLEQTKAQIVFTRITLLGISLGFCVSVVNGKSLWWLAIILGAAFGNTYIGLTALNQKKKLMEQFEVNLEEVK